MVQSSQPEPFRCRLVPGVDVTKGIYQRPRTRASARKQPASSGSSSASSASCHGRGATCVANIAKTSVVSKFDYRKSESQITG